MKKTTLCYSIRGGRVLLAMKKRGFGTGKWNGPGGKMKDGKSAEDACRREVLEETGLTVGVLEDRGIVTFSFPDKPEWDNECRIFVTTDFAGEPAETDEMRPAWYPLESVPYDQMWEDDPHWLPRVLGGGSVRMTFTFDQNGHITNKT